MKKVLTFGEIMMRLVPPGNLRMTQTNSFDFSFGGSESNVAISLANYGAPVSFISRLPDNDFGRAAIQDLKMYGVDTSSILLGGERIGIYYVEMGTSIRNGKVIYDRDHSAFADITPGAIDWQLVFRDVDWFHWSGITPAISHQSAAVCKEAISAANSMGLTISCDLNHRERLWQYGQRPIEVMPDMVKDCNVLIAHADAAEIHLGIKYAGSDSQGFMTEVLKSFPGLSLVVTTQKENSGENMRIRGLLQDRGRRISSKVYHMSHFVDRLGGGDAFMGGLIYGLQNFEEQKALDFAVASTCLKYTIAGDPHQVSLDEIMKLMEGDGSGRIVR